MTDDIDDELDWEEWQKLTEEQQEAIAQRELKAYYDELHKLSPQQLYCYRRGIRLRHLRNARSFIRQGLGAGFWEPRIPEIQKRLVEARLEYYHGQQTGHA